MESDEMLTKIIAQACITMLLFGVSLTNMWFTFGLWPQSWLSYGLCFMATVILLALQTAIHREDV